MPTVLCARAWESICATISLNNLLPTAILSVPTAMLALFARHVLPDGLLIAMARMPFLVHALIGLVVGDIGYYWGHRFSHEIRFLWRFHAIHHSAEDLDFMVHTRAHPLDIVFTHFCGIVPLYLLGLSGPTADTGGSLIVILYMLTSIFWGVFIHANLRWNLGPFQWIASTPKFHHWHHTKTGAINRNYAALFPWIDMLFGTLHLPKRWPKSYGIKTKMPASLPEQLLYPFLRAKPAAPKKPAEAAASEKPVEAVAAE